MTAADAAILADQALLEMETRDAEIATLTAQLATLRAAAVAVLAKNPRLVDDHASYCVCSFCQLAVAIAATPIGGGS